MAAHRSTKVDMPIRVRHQGQQFIGKLLAVNGPAGLLQAPHPMTVGRPAVLQMVRAENGSAQVQLFAQVVRKHQTPGRYIIGWQKAVSPRGILPILPVLRDPLGIIFNDSAVEEADISDSEMVQYDFRADTISVPHRELVIRRHDEAPADVVASTFARRLAKASFPVNGKPPADAPAEDPESDVVEMAQRLGGGEVSLNAPVGDNGKEEYGSFLQDKAVELDEQISEVEGRSMLLRKLEEYREQLSEKELDIFDNRIMSESPLTLQELGDRYSISRERVRQIQVRIIKNIKKWLISEIPDFEEEFSDFIR